MKNKFNVIGLMSGTSLDGLDIAFCEILRSQNKWTYRIKKAETIKYSKRWMEQLRSAALLPAEALLSLDVEYGNYLGSLCKKFISSHAIKTDFIASHGHTVFHQPGNKFTYQLGNGNAIHASSGVPVVFDFRSLDVALGGQGAPLVPVGDKFLFSEYDICLNLGGIANLSMENKGSRIAFDVCFCNMSLNYLIAEKGKSFDNRGEVAATGSVSEKLLKELSKVYVSFRKSRPSLGREIFEKKIQPLFDRSILSVEDKLATSVESTAIEIASTLTSRQKLSMLCTGGGVYNSYLISRILDHCDDRVSIIIPDDDVIKFKEALVFAFLGVLRMNGKYNCLASVTGASRNSSSGVTVGF